MNQFDKLMLRVAAITLVVGAFVATSFAQSAEKPKKEKAKGWIGVSILSIAEESDEEDATAPEEGARVESVVKKSPADSAGLKKGDIVINFGSTAIAEAEDLSKAVSATTPGTKTTVTIMRNGEKKTLGIVVGTMKPSVIKIRKPGSLGVAIAPPLGDENVMIFRGARGTLGMQVRELGEQLAEYFGAPNGEGVLVESVKKESPAEKAGFKAGDVIVRAGKKSVDEVSDIHKALQKLEAGDKIDFEVIRKGTKKVLSATLPEADEVSEDVFHVAPRMRWFHGDGGSFDDALHQFNITVPRQDEKEMQFEVQRLQKDLQERNFDLQKMQKRKIRVSVDDEV